MKNNYIIAKQRNEEGFTLFLGKVSNISGTILEGYKEKDAHIPNKRVLFEIPKKDVLIDLGPEPHPGTAYGFKVGHTYRGSKEHDFFGRLAWFYKPSKEAATKIMQGFDRAQRVLEKEGLAFPENAVWEICSPEAGGKWAGYYKHSKDPEKYPHRFSLKPESLPASEYVYCILHEYAHHIHSEHLTGPKLNGTWIKLFNTSIKLQTIDKQTQSRLLNALITGEVKPSEFRRELEDDDQLAFAWILRTIKADHAVSLQELDTLFEADFKDEIEALWTGKTLHKKDLAPIVSEYATVNYHELFAESVAFHLTKRKLPMAITKLVEKSLSLAKGK